jgi:hypothetical protein
MSVSKYINIYVISKYLLNTPDITSIINKDTSTHGLTADTEKIEFPHSIHFRQEGIHLGMTLVQRELIAEFFSN